VSRAGEPRGATKTTSGAARYCRPHLRRAGEARARAATKTASSAAHAPIARGREFNSREAACSKSRPAAWEKTRRLWVPLRTVPSRCRQSAFPVNLTALPNFRLASSDRNILGSDTMPEMRLVSMLVFALCVCSLPLTADTAVLFSDLGL